MKEDTLNILIHFYRRNLSGFIIFRLFKFFLIYCYSLLKRFYSLHCGNIFSGRYQFSATSISSSLLEEKFYLNFGENIIIPTPIFFGFNARDAEKKTPYQNISSMPTFFAKIKKGVIVGGVDFIFKDGVAIHHDYFDPGLHYSQAENYGIISKARGGIDVNLFLTKNFRKINSGIFLVGQCSNNYAHWLTEFLPKLAIIDACPELESIPLIVDSNLHSNIFSSIMLLNNGKRQIIELDRGESALINDLYFISPTGYERYIPEKLTNIPPEPFSNNYSIFALTKCRNLVLNRCQIESLVSNNSLYIARGNKGNNLRGVQNIDDLERILDQNNFLKLDPTQSSFVDQVKLVSQARLIVSPVGASLANIIFAPPGSTIVILATHYERASYFYYSNLAVFLGHKVIYILGQQIKSNYHPMHRSYFIEKELFNNIITNLNRVVPS